jgi:ubiquinone/menaquinone biosynthesis C-methylase UbiE
VVEGPTDRWKTLPMGWYRDHVFPRVMNRVIDTAETRRIRAEVCAPLTGVVLEIGFGTGLNLPHLPPGVDRLLAVDPMERGRALAAERIAASTAPVEFVGLDGEHVPLPDHSVDNALCTWTLCTIPDPVAAVRQVARVLRPGGALHFVEHGISPDERVRTWQHRCNGIQRRMACGCNLTRDIPALLAEGGLTVDRLTTFYAKHDPKIMGWMYQGVASAA